MNKDVTIESLEACFNLLKAESKEEFLENYRLATHTINSGDAAWSEEERFREMQLKRQKRKLKNQEQELKKQVLKEERKKARMKLHWYTDGKVNVKVAECPVGFHKGKVGKFRNMYGECFR